jgi:flagellar biosynthesis/type III secretory pathway ATPase
MHDIVDREHQDAAAFIKMLMGVYQENFDYVQIGSYQAGTNPTLDTAIRLMPSIEKFLKQDRSEQCSYEKSLEQLAAILHGPNRNSSDDGMENQTRSA